MSFVTPVDGTPAVAEHVAQITETLDGTRAIPVTLVSDLTVYGAVLSNGVTSGADVVVSSGRLTTGAVNSTYELRLQTSAADRWVVKSDGHLFADTDNVYDIGASGANRPRSIYAGTSFIGPGSVPTGGTTNQVLQKTSATNYAVGWVTPSTGITLPLAQHLTFSPDNTYDIGASGATRPRTIYAGTSVDTPAVNASGGTLYFQTSGTSRWYVNTSGHLYAFANNTVDIGAAGARPRDLNLGRNADIGGDLVMSGANKKIIADFTSATQVRFETNQANQSTSFQVQPNGTSRLSSFFCWDANPTTNSVYGGFSADNGVVKLAMGKLGTASNPNMHITTQAQGPVVYIWDSGRVDILKGPLRVEAGGIVAVYPGLTGSLNYGGISHDSFFQGFGGASFDLGNANTLVNQLKGVKAWGGGATISCTGSTGFVVGGAVITAPATLAMGNGESYIFIAQQGYWWSIASQGVI